MTNRRNATTKVLAIVVTLALVIGLMPATAYSLGDEAEGLDAGQPPAILQEDATSPSDAPTAADGNAASPSAGNDGTGAAGDDAGTSPNEDAKEPEEDPMAEPEDDNSADGDGREAELESSGTILMAQAQGLDGDWSFTSDDGMNATITGYNGSDTDITIPSSVSLGYDLTVTHIGEKAFFRADITSAVIPEPVRDIGDEAFARCHELSSVTFSGSSELETIGSHAFEECWNLDAVEIPYGVRDIGKWAFSDCRSISSITIPGTVENAGEEAFSNCESLESITICRENEDELTLGPEFFSFSRALTARLVWTGEESLRDKYVFDVSPDDAGYRIVGNTLFWDEIGIRSVTIFATMDESTGWDGAAAATLTFDLGGGSLDGKTGAITVVANVGETINLPDAPTKEGYTFKYWKGSEYAAGAEYVVEGDHEFTAVWEKNAAVTPHTKQAKSGAVASKAREIPRTGDEPGIFIVGPLVLAAASMFFAAFIARRRDTQDM